MTIHGASRARIAGIGAASLSLLIMTATAAFPQASLSTQGFGFPTGQLSARAYGTGGAIAEMDPLSPINPAAIGMIGTRLVFFQLEPEYRSVTVNDTTERTTTARYPVVFGALPIGSHWVLSLGSSTLLDRTGTTVFNTTQIISAVDTVPSTTKFRIDGAMDDARLALAWTPTSWIHLGVGGHAITGHNLVTVTQSFADTITFSPFTQSRVLSFSGAAVSAGVQLVSKYVTAAFSGRTGGSVRLLVGDTVLSKGNVPNRFGASIAYTGLANSAIAIRTSHDSWSSLGSLGSPSMRAVDAWDTSVGADIAGPRLAPDRFVFLRGGFRARTLPFQADGHDVTEHSVTGGLGTSFANGRVLTDLAVIHATRSAGLPASERAWTISIGLSVRP